MNISDNTLKLLKRAAKLDYSTPWQPVLANEPLATGTLARTFPDINTTYAKARLRDTTEAANNALHFGREYTDLHFLPQYFPYQAISKLPFMPYGSRPMPFWSSYARKPVKGIIIPNQKLHIRLYSEFLGAKDPQYMQDQLNLAQARRWAKQQRLNGQPVSVAAFNAFKNNKTRANVITIDPGVKYQQALESHIYPLYQIDSIVLRGIPAGYFYDPGLGKTLSMPVKSAYGLLTFWHPRSMPASDTIIDSAQQAYFYDPDLVEEDPETGEVIRDKNPYMFKRPALFTARMQALQDFYRAQTGKTALNPLQAMDYVTNYVDNKGWLKQKGTLEQRLNSKSVAKHLQKLTVLPLRTKLGYKPKVFWYGNRSATDWRNKNLEGNKTPQGARFINDNWFNY